VSQVDCARLREGVPYGKVYRYNPKHLCPKLKGYGDNGHSSWDTLYIYIYILEGICFENKKRKISYTPEDGHIGRNM
jgi:hypothetical protein